MYLDYDDEYLCMYEINEKLLKDYEGFGFYLDIFFSRDCVSVAESAILSRLICFDNLVSVKYISTDIDPEDLS